MLHVNAARTSRARARQDALPTPCTERPAPAVAQRRPPDRDPPSHGAAAYPVPGTALLPPSCRATVRRSPGSRNGRATWPVGSAPDAGRPARRPKSRPARAVPAHRRVPQPLPARQGSLGLRVRLRHESQVRPARPRHRPGQRRGGAGPVDRALVSGLGGRVQHSCFVLVGSNLLHGVCIENS